MHAKNTDSSLIYWSIQVWANMRQTPVFYSHTSRERDSSQSCQQCSELFMSEKYSNNHELLLLSQTRLLGFISQHGSRNSSTHLTACFSRSTFRHKESVGTWLLNLSFCKRRCEENLLKRLQVFFKPQRKVTLKTSDPQDSLHLAWTDRR